MLKSGLFACPTCGLSMQVEMIILCWSLVDGYLSMYAPVLANELGCVGQRSGCDANASGVPWPVQENPLQGLP